jgi:hypothetical protein
MYDEEPIVARVATHEAKSVGGNFFELSIPLDLSPHLAIVTRIFRAAFPGFRAPVRPVDTTTCLAQFCAYGYLRLKPSFFQYITRMRPNQPENFFFFFAHSVLIQIKITLTVLLLGYGRRIGRDSFLI